MLTVQEVWRRALPGEARLLAGVDGLGRQVSDVVFMRTRMPAFSRLRGDEFAVVPMAYLPLLDGQPSLERVMREVVRQGVSALLVLGEPPPGAVKAADEYTLPLFELPDTLDARELESEVGRAISAANADLYRRGTELYRSLTDILIQRQGLAALVERIGQLAQRPVAFEDELPALQVWVPGSDPTFDPPERQVREHLARQADELRSWSARTRLVGSDPPTTLLPFSERRWARVVAPVVLPGTPGAMPVGWVSIFGRPDELGAVELQVASRGAAACAVELANQRAVTEAEERHRSDFLDELLAGTLGSEALALRAEQIGIRLDEPHAAVVVRLADTADPDRAGSSGPGLARLHRAVEAELHRLAPAALTAERADHVLAVVAVTASGEAPPKVAEAAVAGVRGRLRGVGVAAATGRVYPGAAGVRQSYREAQQALAIGEALFPGTVVHFADLGIYRLLFALPDATELRAIYDETLRPLAERDERGELLHTLETYLSVNGSATRAAELLHLHRNTLAYRLRRIEEITGADLEDAERRLAFQVAIRARSVLRARNLL